MTHRRPEPQPVSLCATCVHIERPSCKEAGAEFVRESRGGRLITLQCSQYQTQSEPEPVELEVVT